MSHAKDEFMEMNAREMEEMEIRSSEESVKALEEMWKMSNEDKHLIPTSMDEPVQWFYGFHEQTLLGSLLHTSNYENPQRANIEREINDMTGMTEERYYKLQLALRDAQLDPVLAGTYNMKELNKYLKRML